MTAAAEPPLPPDPPNPGVPPGTVMAPMNPQPGVPTTLMWEEGTRPDGTKVMVTCWLFGCVTARVELDEQMGLAFADALRATWSKPTLQIARDLPQSNGQGPHVPGPFRP